MKETNQFQGWYIQLKLDKAKWKILKIKEELWNKSKERKKKIKKKKQTKDHRVQIIRKIRRKIKKKRKFINTKEK